MDSFYERKAARTACRNAYVLGWKLRPCSACNGSGHYDHNGAPACGACDGTGKERYKNPSTGDYDLPSSVRMAARHLNIKGG